MILETTIGLTHKFDSWHWYAVFGLGDLDKPLTSAPKRDSSFTTQCRNNQVWRVIDAGGGFLFRHHTAISEVNRLVIPVL